MPLYEYTCKVCKTRFTILQRIGATEKETQCIYCGSGDVKKEMSSFSSSGFARTSGSGSFPAGST
jgi:putative FmdB family regulatory protein